MPVDVSEEDLASFFAAAVSLTRDGGDLVRAAISDRDKGVEMKSSAVDLVTETDRAVEKLLFDGLRFNEDIKDVKRSSVIFLSSLVVFRVLQYCT